MLQAAQIALAATVALGYFVVAGFVVPRIRLDDERPGFNRAVRLGALVFFVGCGLTHTHILIHAIEFPDRIALHEVVFHLAQVGGVWVFALAAVRVLDVRIERRKSGADRLREEVEQLSRSNADLEDFANVVSHDLQEPLATLRGYARLLDRRHGDELGDEGREMLAQIDGQAERMRGLLAGVLAYSRAAGAGMSREELALDTVVADVRRALATRLQEAGGTFTADPLPTVWGDPVQLEQVLQNLVANALKFAADGRPPEVHLSARPDDTGWTFELEDNGIGIHPADAERVFAPFERAHGDVPGSGIGLAVCRKVVERHGGRIWMAPRDDGPGTVVRFTLPQRLPVAAERAPSLSAR
jgi:signal transduction histidine kinase